MINKNNIYGYEYFRTLYLKRKKKFSKSLFYNIEPTRLKTIEVPRDLHKKLVTSYLDIYFSELFFRNRPKYFFLGGTVQKMALTPKSHSIDKLKRRSGLTLVWYRRPDMGIFFNVKLRKQSGQGKKMTRLEDRFKAEQGLDSLPPFYSGYKKIMREKLLTS